LLWWLVGGGWRAKTVGKTGAGGISKHPFLEVAFQFCIFLVLDLQIHPIGIVDNPDEAVVGCGGLFRGLVCEFSHGPYLLMVRQGIVVLLVVPDEGLKHDIRHILRLCVESMVKNIF
jgi:hypothetical protein